MLLDRAITYLKKCLCLNAIRKQDADLKNIKIKGPLKGADNALWLSRIYSPIADVEIYGQKFLALCHGGNIRLPNLRNHISNLRKSGISPLFVFMVLPAYQRQSLIADKVDFVVVDKCISLPTLFMCFEGSDRTTVQGCSGKISMLAQKILLLKLYDNNDSQPSLVKDYVSALHVSATAVSKAYDELASFMPKYFRKTGRERYFLEIPANEKMNVYLEARPFLSSPVRRVDTVPYSEALKRLPMSGEMAFGKITMLAPSDIIPRYALYYKDKSVLETSCHKVVEDDSVYKVEKWSYLIDYHYSGAAEFVVDPISLILSLEHEKPYLLEEERYLIERDGLLLGILEESTD